MLDPILPRVRVASLRLQPPGWWQWMQPTGFAIGETNGLMQVEESKDHDTFIAWACASDSVVTPWVLRVRRWVGGAF